MNDLVYSFQVAGGAFTTHNVAEAGSLAALSCPIDHGFFYDQMGSGFVFAPSTALGLVAVFADPVSVCKASGADNNEPAPHPSPDSIELSSANVSRGPTCKRVNGTDLVIRFDGADGPEYTYQPVDVDWQLTVTADGMLNAVTIGNYLDYFWDDANGGLAQQAPTDDDYATFAEYFDLLDGLEVAEGDVEEIATELDAFRSTTLARMSASERLRILSREIEAYRDHWS